MAGIDTHLHIWRNPERYSWLSDGLAPINRDIDVDEAFGASLQIGCDSAILVQAADTDEDTDFLLSLADKHDWILGVVGWIPLDDPQTAGERLEELADRPLVGIRSLIHDLGDPEFLDQDTVRETLALVADQGLAFDVPDAYPGLLPSATRLAWDMPDLKIVLDHLGKPPAGDLRTWSEQLTEFAGSGNTYAKISGLHHGGTKLSDQHALAAVRHAVRSFGMSRLMVGSDYPMPLLGDGMQEMAQQMQEAIDDSIADDAFDDLWFINAEEVYGLIDFSTAGLS